MSTYSITGKEPHEPKSDFTVIVSAPNETLANKYVKWLFGVGGKLSATPTNDDARYFYNPKHLPTNPHSLTQN